MVVPFGLMAGVIVIMRPMFSTVLVIMHVSSAAVSVLMEVLVQVLMCVAMGVFMAVLSLPVGMSVGVHVSVVVPVQMLVLVFSFHDNPPVHQVVETLHGFVDRKVTLNSLDGSRGGDSSGGIGLQPPGGGIERRSSG
jgi:hypothetical protein